MGISYLIVTLALSNVQYESTERYSAFMAERSQQRQSSVPMLVAGGNPWATPESKRWQAQRAPAPALPMNQPRFVTPEELNSLGRKPEQLVPRDWNWAPLNMEGFGSGMNYGNPGYYGQGNYPGNRGYAYPPFFGNRSMMVPYNDMPFGGMNYEELLPFTY